MNITKIEIEGTSFQLLQLLRLVKENNLENSKKIYAPLSTHEQETVSKIELALGFELYDWQKEFIFHNHPYTKDIKRIRQSGKTTAHCIKMCLSSGKPIVIYMDDVPACDDFIYFGEDSFPLQRRKFFIYELSKIYGKLKSAEINLREITFCRKYSNNRSPY